MRYLIRGTLWVLGGSGLVVLGICAAIWFARLLGFDAYVGG